LNTFIRRADVVKIACLAQLVNIIAPIMTNKEGGAWRQTIFYPFLFASRYGRGKSLRLQIDCPAYDWDEIENVPFLDASAVFDEESGATSLFLVNRHQQDTLDFELSLTGFGDLEVADFQLMTHPDLLAVNTEKNPNNVVPVPGDGANISGGTLSVPLPPLSFQMIRLKKAGQ